MPMQRIEPGPGQESVWDYPRPPALERTPKRIRVLFSGLVIADSTECWRVLETSHPPAYYIPPDHVRLDLLEPVAGQRSVCEWKGTAAYWSIRTADALSPTAAWSYPKPSPAYATLADHLSFYAGRVDEAWVDDEQVTPQEGDFYGGWITSEVVGPFKGAAGTWGW